MDNLNFNNLIQIEDNLYCVNDIAEKLILSKNVKEYIKKINNKKLIKGNYYISKDDMLKILSKCKTVIGQQYLNFINGSDKPIDNKKFIDYKTNIIIYNDNKILFFEYNEELYFNSKDVCDLLKYSDYFETVNKYVDKDNILNNNLLQNINHIPNLPNTIFINDFGFFELITSSKLLGEEIKKIKRWFTSDILVSLHKINSYNKMYDVVKLRALESIPCVYLIHVNDSLYKFGQSKHILKRMNLHKKNLSYINILKIYELPNLDIAINLENNIKKYTINAKIRKYIEEGVEFFEINKNFPIERVIKDINLICDNEILLHEKLTNLNYLDSFSLNSLNSLDILEEYDKLITIEQEKTKQANLEIRKQELDIRKQELELELLKLKEK